MYVDDVFYPKYPYYILAVLIMVVYLRVLSLLRLFTQTRALIRLVIEVAKDMGAFAVVLTLALFAFTITYNVMEASEQVTSSPIGFSNSLSSVYLIM